MKEYEKYGNVLYKKHALLDSADDDFKKRFLKVLQGNIIATRRNRRR